MDTGHIVRRLSSRVISRFEAEDNRVSDASNYRLWREDWIGVCEDLYGVNEFFPAIL
jgi:hypothetical protein